MPVIPVPVPLRDRLITEFRRFICDRIKFVPFTHQAAWWATTDGLDLVDEIARDCISTEVREPSGDIVTKYLVPRPAGRAKVVAELGAYKSGKSAGAAIWAAAFAAVPHARVFLVGNEYYMCAP